MKHRLNTFGILLAFLFACEVGAVPPIERNIVTTNANVTASGGLGITQSGSTVNFDGAGIVAYWHSLFGSHTIVIDPNGNDAIAATNVYGWPWKTAYDVLNTTNGQYIGAITHALPGDSLVINSSMSGPVFPLNYFGVATNGLNLYIPFNVVLNRRDYGNTNGTPFHAWEGAGSAPGSALVVPGNNSLIFVQGNITATNDYSNGFDSAVGIFPIASTFSNIPGGITLTLGFTNNPATNIVVTGGGSIFAMSDTIFISGLSGNPSSGYFSFLHLGGWWDLLRLSQGTFKSLDLDIVGTYNSTFSEGLSALFLASGATLFDSGSSCRIEPAGISSGTQNSFYPLINSGSANLSGTKLIFWGTNNPVAYLNNAGATIGGSWSSQFLTNDVLGSGIDSTAFTNIQETFSRADAGDFQAVYSSSNYYSLGTNYIVVAGAGTTTVNGNYVYNSLTFAYTNTSVSSRLITNFVPGNINIWAIYAANSVRYAWTNAGSGAPITAAWSHSNGTGTAPDPTTTVQTLQNYTLLTQSIGIETPTNWVEGKSYTNSFRAISVRATAFVLPASVIGQATEELQLDRTHSGSFSTLDRFGEQTIVGNLVETNFGSLRGVIPPYSVFTFTNTSVGAGNAAGLITGTGQILNE